MLSPDADWSSVPEVRGRAPSVGSHRGVDDVHLLEPLRPLGDRSGDGRKTLLRLLDDLTGVVDDSPAPVGLSWCRERQDLHARLPRPAEGRRRWRMGSWGWRTTPRTAGEAGQL